MSRKRKATRPFRRPDGLTAGEQADQAIEAAIGDLDLNYPADRLIAARWAHEATLPPLADERGLEILGNPEGTLDLGSDEKAQFRTWLLAQPGGRPLYEAWIVERMKLRERSLLRPDRATPGGR